MNLSTSRRRPILIAATLVFAFSTIVSAPLLAQPAQPVLEPAADESGDYVPEAGEIKTLAVVAISSYGEVIGDIGFVGSLVDRPELGQMLEGMIAMFTQGKGLVAIDKSKPWGVIVQTDGMSFLPVGCLPVTDFDGLLGIVQGFGIPITDGEDGIKQIATPDGKMLHVKHEGTWAFIAQSPASFAQLPADPESALAPLVEDYDVGTKVSIQNVPAMYRQMAMQAMKSGMEDGLKRREGEGEEEYQTRRELAEKQVAQIERMFNEFDEIAVGWSLDSEQQRALLDIIYRFVPGSKMATQYSSYGQPRTNFAGFFQPEATVTMSAATEADPELIREDLDQMKAMFKTLRSQMEKAIDEDEDLPDDAARAAFKSGLGDFLDAAQATIESGHIDSGAALHLRPGSLTFVAGAHMKQAEKIESGLKKIAEAAEKKPDFPGMQWNAASHAGVNFHTLTVPIPADEEDARKMFGESVDVAIGIGDETVYAAVGADNLNMVNQAIDTSAAEPNKEVPPFEVSASIGQIMSMVVANADEEDRAMAESISDMLNAQAQGRDHIRATGKWLENGVRYRIEVEEGVLRAIGKAAEAQRKAQEQQQQPVGR